MGVPRLKLKMSVEEYLQSEPFREVRHEFVDGEIYAMAGVSKRHNRINQILLDGIREKLSGSDCETFFVDVKLKVEKFNRFYYPDLVVVCDDDTESDYYITKPAIVVEILSPNTAATDRREKMFAYQQIDSLQEYLMIDQDTQFAELYRRRDDGLWSWIIFEAGEDLEFTSIDFKMPLSDLYS